MARKPYKCPLAGEEVQVLVEKIIVEKKVIFNDPRPRAKRVSPELRFCSHIGIGECIVRRAESERSDVEGFPYSGTATCAYLLLLGRHD